MRRAGLQGLAATAGCLGLAACGSDVQSVLAPGGVDAERIAGLSWLLFGSGAFVLAIVMAAVWTAACGPRQARRLLAREKAVFVLGLVVPAVTLTMLLGYGVWLMRSQLDLAKADEAVRIDVIGEQWWWRVAYVGANGAPVAGANEIRIPIGRSVGFTLRAADVIHSFWVPSLGGKVDMIPGRTTRLRLTAQRPGIYRGQCAEYCGGPHALMAFHVIALSGADHDAWWARETAPAKEPATDLERRGQSLFNGAGCGACHAVRGTAAAGAIGPDLTHIGSRRSVGIDTLPLTQRNLMRFIVDGQHVKPGNRMPEYRILKLDEGEAIAAYLVSLR